MLYASYASQPEFGVFYLFHNEQPVIFEKLQPALEKAVEIARREAAEMAESAGATAIETRIKQEDNHIRHDIDGELFVSATITAVATGRPNCVVQAGQPMGIPRGTSV